MSIAQSADSRLECMYLYTVPWTYRDPESYENYASIDFEVTQPFGLQFYISYSLILLYSLRLIYIKTKARFCII